MSSQYQNLEEECISNDKQNGFQDPLDTNDNAGCGDTNILIQTYGKEPMEFFIIRTTRKPLRFILTLAFNLGPVYAVFPFISVLRVYHNIKSGHIKFSWQYLRLAALDLAMCCNVLYIFLLFFSGLVDQSTMDAQGQLYYNWSMSGVVFITIYTIFVTWKECMMVGEHNVEKRHRSFHPNLFGVLKYIFNLLLSSQNFQALCLGVYADEYSEKINISVEQQKEIDTLNFNFQIEKIMQHMGVDKTLVFFSLNKEQEFYENQTEKERNKMLNELPRARAIAIAGMRELGFYGSRHIVEDFLLPLYLKTRAYLHIKVSTKLTMGFVIILIKVLIPTFVLVSPINVEVLLQTILFASFYLHFVSICSLMQRNDDLKTRNYFLQMIKKLLDIQEYMKSRQTTQMIDISCALSLQSWDTMRQITLQIDRAKSVKYSFLFGFLVLYGKLCFGVYLCCTLRISLFEHFLFCSEPIILYNMHVDVVFQFNNSQFMIGFICLMRIYQGQKYNQALDETQELIFRLVSLYEDLQTLFEFYFSQGMNGMIQNNTYRSVVLMILAYAEKKKSEKQIQIEHSSYEEEEDASTLEVAREKITEMKEAMEKISEIVLSDRNHYEYKFLGVYYIEFSKALKIVALVMLSFIPSMFHKLSKYIGEMA